MTTLNIFSKPYNLGREVKVPEKNEKIEFLIEGLSSLKSASIINTKFLAEINTCASFDIFDEAQEISPVVKIAERITKSPHLESIFVLLSKVSYQSLEKDLKNYGFIKVEEEGKSKIYKLESREIFVRFFPVENEEQEKATFSSLNDSLQLYYLRILNNFLYEFNSWFLLEKNRSKESIVTDDLIFFFKHVQRFELSEDKFFNYVKLLIDYGYNFGYDPPDKSTFENIIKFYKVVQEETFTPQEKAFFEHSSANIKNIHDIANFLAIHYSEFKDLEHMNKFIKFLIEIKGIKVQKITTEMYNELILAVIKRTEFIIFNELGRKIIETAKEGMSKYTDAIFESFLELHIKLFRDIDQINRFIEYLKNLGFKNISLIKTEKYEELKKIYKENPLIDDLEKNLKTQLSNKAAFQIRLKFNRLSEEVRKHQTFDTFLLTNLSEFKNVTLLNEFIYFLNNIMGMKIELITVEQFNKLNKETVEAQLFQQIVTVMNQVCDETFKGDLSKYDNVYFEQNFVNNPFFNLTDLGQVNRCINFLKVLGCVNLHEIKANKFEKLIKDKAQVLNRDTKSHTTEKRYDDIKMNMERFIKEKSTKEFERWLVEGYGLANVESFGDFIQYIKYLNASKTGYQLKLHYTRDEFEKLDKQFFELGKNMTDVTVSDAVKARKMQYDRHQTKIEQNSLVENEQDLFNQMKEIIIEKAKKVYKEKYLNFGDGLFKAFLEENLRKFYDFNQLNRFIKFLKELGFKNISTLQENKFDEIKAKDWRNQWIITKTVNNKLEAKQKVEQTEEALFEDLSQTIRGFCKKSFMGNLTKYDDLFFDINIIKNISKFKDLEQLNRFVKHLQKLGFNKLTIISEERYKKLIDSSKLQQSQIREAIKKAKPNHEEFISIIGKKEMYLDNDLYEFVLKKRAVGEYASTFEDLMSLYRELTEKGVAFLNAPIEIEAFKFGLYFHS